MRILRLRSYCYPETTAASSMMDDLDEAFAKNEITIIYYTPVPSRGISDEVRREYKKKKYEELKNGHVVIHRFPMIKEGTNIAQKALKYFLCTVVEYGRGIAENNIDLLFCSSTPPTQGMLSAMVAKKLSRKYKHKVPFVYNLQDIFPDSLVTTGMTKQGSLIWKIGRGIENYTYRHADRIIVISEDFKKNIMAKGVPENKIVVIPNWADTEGVYPVSRENNILFDRYHLDRNKFYFCYSGTIGHTQNMDLLLDAAKELKDELHDVRFMLIGEGAAKERVEHRIKEEAINNVIVLPFQPSEELASVFSLADVGLIISKPGVGKSSVPSKTWNMMAAEKPILASFDRNSELSSLIEKTGCGTVAEAGNKEELKEAIRCMAADTQLKEKGMLGNRYLKQEIDKDKCVNGYIQTLRSTLEESKK